MDKLQDFLDSLDESIFPPTEYKTQTPRNIPAVYWLDKAMVGHKGFVAGGCFKNILTGTPVKDIDIFFESESDWDSAVQYFNKLVDDDHSVEKWKFKFRSDNVSAFQLAGETWWIELVCSEFGPPQEILDSFDFSITKMAYVKVEVPDLEDEGETKLEYQVLYHPDFFEHLQTKGLVLDRAIPFPISTWLRTYEYGNKGYKLCRDSRVKLLSALRAIPQNLLDKQDNFYEAGGWD